jgi:hypothetical protein
MARYVPEVVHMGATAMTTIEAAAEARYTGRLPYCRAMACQKMVDHPYKRNMTPVPLLMVVILIPVDLEIGLFYQ